LVKREKVTLVSSPCVARCCENKHKANQVDFQPTTKDAQLRDKHFLSLNRTPFMLHWGAPFIAMSAARALNTDAWNFMSYSFRIVLCMNGTLLRWWDKTSLQLIVSKNIRMRQIPPWDLLYLEFYTPLVNSITAKKCKIIAQKYLGFARSVLAFEKFGYGNA
jgi:hypothetical protein